MKKLNLKHWAIVLTLITLVLGIINAAIDRPLWLDQVAGVIGLAAIVLWIVLWARYRKKNPRLARVPDQVKPSRNQSRIVTVVYADLLAVEIDEYYEYTYRWELAEYPTPGDRVVVQAGDEYKYAVVTQVDVPRPEGIPLKSVVRLVPQDEINDAHLDAAVNTTEWLAMAKHAANIPDSDIVPFRAIPGFPAVAPPHGHASADDADTYGRMWWRAFKLAQEHDEDPRAITHFRSIAQRWFMIRDQGGNAEL